MDIHGALQLLNDPTVQTHIANIRDGLIDDFFKTLAERGLGKGAHILARFFKKRFENSTREEIAFGLKRANDFSTLLDHRIRHMEADGALPSGVREAKYDKPEIVDAIHAAFDEAVETDDQLRLEVLADLVAERLKADDETLKAIASRNAINAARSVTARQLRGLALIQLIHLQFNTKDQEEYARLLQRFVQPLVNMPISEYDLQHLQSLGLISYDAMATSWENLGTPALLNPIALHFPWLGQHQPIIGEINKRAHGDGKKGITPLMECRVTPAGSILAACALKDLVALQVPVDFE